MGISKNDVKDATISTIKGAISTVPFIGGLFAEYISLAQSKIADKRASQWQAMVEEQLQKLHTDFDSLTENEFFFSCIQVATINPMRAYQDEKRQLFANTILNSIHLDLDSDKKMLFLSLLDRYTLAGIRLLKYYSENHYHEEDFTHHSGMVTSYTIGGTEYPTTYILKSCPDFKNDENYLKSLSEQLTGDGLISKIDFNIPESPKQARRKRTTRMGDEFLSFISSE